MQPSIELHIEELVLHDFPVRDHSRIGTAIERELMRLCIEQGVPPELLRGGELGDIAPGSFHMNQGVMPEAIGRKIAHAVYRGLSLGAKSVSKPSRYSNLGNKNAVQTTQGWSNNAGGQKR
ncbi:hypothetical protein PAALTS15_18233 [Paenibacillus alvei TS-15]|uniref:Uncharacterized protein n=1 Tax=Paenibacillus alvei TS-15 TaxID=1117108 RepID=S9U5L1_PAEAL|nr:hypothetical protein [Paenibacillus alvei]EPY05765.1 hypothetical protein PAALTS15_18233 [Paenibacillus alvei TS-15]